VKFLVDPNLPPARARWLASEGHEAHHVSDFGFEGMPDRAIWQHAAETHASIVTKDEYFVLLQALDRTGSPVVWIRIGNAAQRVLLRRLPSRWPAVVSAIERGEKKSSRLAESAKCADARKRRRIEQGDIRPG
jgi:predicted nuclease of predicted toxin-antitoxin system